MASLGHFVVRVREAYASTPRSLIEQARRKLESHGPIAPELIVMLENEAQLRGMDVERYLKVIQGAADKKDMKRELGEREEKALAQFEYILQVLLMRL